MMSVLEYAQDVSLDVKVVLELCKKLGINVSSEDDILDDDGILASTISYIISIKSIFSLINLLVLAI